MAEAGALDGAAAAVDGAARGSGPYFATFKNSTSCLSFLRNCSSR